MVVSVSGANQPFDASGFYTHEGTGKPKQRATNRDPMGLLVHPTGLAPTNVEGAEAIDGLAESLGYKEKAYSAVFAGNEATNQVLVYITNTKAAGATAVRHNKGRDTITLYLHELFDVKPGLRPEKKRWCRMEQVTDHLGVPCFVISLRVALEQKKGIGKARAPKPVPMPKLEAKAGEPTALSTAAVVPVRPAIGNGLPAAPVKGV